MGIIAADNGSGLYKQVPPGNYIGRCFRIIDLGTQNTDYQGLQRSVRKVMISFELFGDDELGNALVMENGAPLTISKRYTLSLSDKSALKSDLESWRGRAFTAEELKGFDLSKLLGVYCMVNTKADNREGKNYINIASLSPVPKILKENLPIPHHQIYVFDVDNPDMDIFNSFYEKLKDTIKMSAEWNKKKSAINQPENIPTSAVFEVEFNDDDISF